MVVWSELAKAAGRAPPGALDLQVFLYHTLIAKLTHQVNDIGGRCPT
jgi:hypothetical protein